MKKIETKNILKLNKQTIANLDSYQLQNIKGGIENSIADNDRPRLTWKIFGCHETLRSSCDALIL